MKIFSISLGCPKNRVDTEKALAFSHEFEIVDQPQEAECIFINTCGFITPAIKESVRNILDYGELKESSDNKKYLVVAGCLVGRFGIEALAQDLPEVDLFLDVKNVHQWGLKLAEMLEKDQPGKRFHASGRPRLLSTPTSYAWLKISEGCRHACAFCTIPSIRGPLRSFSQESIIKEAEYILDQGTKEIILIAQDLTDWGRDTDHKLEEILDALLNMDKLKRLRLLYLYPNGLTEELLAFLKSAGQAFVPYFDIPLQHASEKILKRMGRPFASNPELVVDRVRKYFPEAALRTTFITGFPGEKAEDVERLLDFVYETRFHHLGVFAYEAEEGTRAAKMPDQIPQKEKELRRDRVMELQREISQEIMESYQGTEQEIIVDYPHEEWPGLHVGRTWFQAPEIDGQTFISGPKVKPGNIVRAEISDADIYDLSALSLEKE